MSSSSKSQLMSGNPSSINCANSVNNNSSFPDLISASDASTTTTEATPWSSNNPNTRVAAMCQASGIVNEEEQEQEEEEAEEMISSHPLEESSLDLKLQTRDTDAPNTNRKDDQNTKEFEPSMSMRLLHVGNVSPTDMSVPASGKSNTSGSNHYGVGGKHTIRNFQESFNSSRTELHQNTSNPAAAASPAQVVTSTHTGRNKAGTRRNRNRSRSRSKSRPSSPRPPLSSASTRSTGGSGGLGNYQRRSMFKRSSSVPMIDSSGKATMSSWKSVDMRHQRGQSRTQQQQQRADSPTPETTSAHPTSLSSYIDQSKPIIQSPKDAESHAEDSTIEESWRPNPDKRRIWTETMMAGSSDIRNCSSSSNDNNNNDDTILTSPLPTTTSLTSAVKTPSTASAPSVEPSENTPTQSTATTIQSLSLNTFMDTLLPEGKSKPFYHHGNDNIPYTNYYASKQVQKREQDLQHRQTQSDDFDGSQSVGDLLDYAPQCLYEDYDAEINNPDHASLPDLATFTPSTSGKGSVSMSSSVTTGLLRERAASTDALSQKSHASVASDTTTAPVATQHYSSSDVSLTSESISVTSQTSALNASKAPAMIAQGGNMESLSHTQMPVADSTITAIAAATTDRSGSQVPIAWTHKTTVWEESSMASSHRQLPTRAQSMMDSSTSQRGQKQQKRYQHQVQMEVPPNNGTIPNQQDGTNPSTNAGMLNAFLDRESRHERPSSSAHTVSGDPRAKDSVSIAISSDGGQNSRTFTVGHKEAKMIEKLLEATQSDDDNDNDDNKYRSGNDTITSKGFTNNSQAKPHHGPSLALVIPQKQPQHYVNPWLSTPPEQLQTPTEHNHTVATNTSTIAESDRVSTRSSLIVELSPPLVAAGSKPDLKKYLDHKRRSGRKKGSCSAFTVAGDRVSVRFQGKSTSELVELLREEKEEREQSGKHQNFGRGNKLRPAKSGARHPRSDLDGIAFAPDLNAMNAMHESISFIHRYDSTMIFGSPKNAHPSPLKIEGDVPSEPPLYQSPEAPKVVSATRAEMQSYLDGRSPNSQRRNSGAHSVSGVGVADYDRQRRRRSRSKSGTRSQGKEKNFDPLKDWTYSPTLLTAFESSKNLELEDFKSPSGGRPTNRRSLMRKMQSVPILDTKDPNRIPSITSTSRQTTRSSLGERRRSRERRSSSQQPPRKLSGLERQSPSLQPSKKRATSERRGRKKTQQGVSSDRKTRKSSSVKREKKKDSVSQKHRRPKHEANEDEELNIENMHKSFIDQFLEGDVLGHDSSSEIKAKKGEYKASLMENPIENSSSKLRVEPEVLGSSQRLILNDPLKSSDRRSESKRVKSASNIDEPSPQLTKLYDASSAPLNETTAVVEDFDSVESEQVGSPKTPKKSLKKAVGMTPAENRTKKKSKKMKKVVKSPKEKTLKKVMATASETNDEDGLVEDSTESLEVRGRDTGLDAMVQPEKRTLNDLPRQRLKKNVVRGEHEVDIPDGSGHVRLVGRLMKLSNRNLMAEDNPGKTAAKFSTEGKSGTIAGGNKLLATSRTNPAVTTKFGPTGAMSLSNESEAFDVSQASGWTKQGIDFPPLTASDTISPKKNSTDESGVATTNDLPAPPIRKLSRPPATVSGSPERTTPTSKLPNTPVHTHAPRLAPVAIAEGSILEVTDDMSACSDVTDQFSWEPLELENAKKPKQQRPGLIRIDESDPQDHEDNRTFGGTSWAGLSLSENRGVVDDASIVSALSRDKRRHLSKRWQSSPNLGTGPDILKSPSRETDNSSSTIIGSSPKITVVSSTPLRWIKQKMGFMKQSNKKPRQKNS